MSEPVAAGTGANGAGSEAGREASTNAKLWGRATRVTPGGVNSPVRAFKAVGGQPYFVTRGEGAYVWDADGRRYIDYVQSYGASILGHAHPQVVGAIRQAALAGTTFGAPTPGEVRLAEAICARVPGCEQVRLVSSGTEAAMSAVRLARAATGRDRVVVFAGCYHGHSDGLLAGGGSGVASLGLPASAGVPKAAVAETLVVPYNKVPDIATDVAAVIVEPIAANMGLVPPRPGFLEGLRAACDRSGTLLIFDEVITGFRVGPGGASALFGLQPDLWCFGKVVGGGLPLAAFGGSQDLMEQLAPNGRVYQAGTLSGNPLATAAGAVVLSLLDDDAYKQLALNAGRLAAGLAAAAAEAGLQVSVPVAGPLVGIFGGPGRVGDYDEARAAVATGVYAPLMRGLLEAGSAIAPGPYEVLFPSLAHTDADLEATVSAFAEVARRVAAST
ncbi:MAG TPA: glutamate-1-semialdehyde 2,1-aminomutase [Acidimicrobiales bacterium]|nr:glutamate-1-semialdehyde 2,1-aminomutase [Acidimicrobiales bacterium]